MIVQFLGLEDFFVLMRVSRYLRSVVVPQVSLQRVELKFAEFQAYLTREFKTDKYNQAQLVFKCRDLLRYLLKTGHLDEQRLVSFVLAETPKKNFKSYLQLFMQLLKGNLELRQLPDQLRKELQSQPAAVAQFIRALAEEDGLAQNRYSVTQREQFSQRFYQALYESGNYFQRTPNSRPYSVKNLLQNSPQFLLIFLPIVIFSEATNKVYSSYRNSL